MRDAANCVCLGAWLPLGRSHPRTLSKATAETQPGPLQDTARASGLLAAARAVLPFSSCQEDALNPTEPRGGVALFVDTVGLHAVRGLCQVGNPINILVTRSY